MPELPDVEIARRDLTRWLVGATITTARCDDAYVIRPKSPRAFAQALAGETVARVERRGKWLRLLTSGGGRLFSHLGMTGEWVKAESGAPAKPAERARLDVTRRGRSSSVRYLDARRFGRLIATPGDIAEWSELGPDPLADGIDAASLARQLSARRRSVKEVLMDQTVLAGIGNILATEALWLARLDPRSRARAVRVPGDVRAVVRGIHRAIARNFALLGGQDAGFFVYGRAGEPCPRCGTLLRTVTLGGRSSAYCPGCQRRRR